MLAIMWIVLIGLVAGAIAKLLIPGKSSGGWILTAMLGIGGAFLGSWVGRRFPVFGPGQTGGILLSTLGAVALLILYHLLRRKKS